MYSKSRNWVLAI